MPFTFKQFHIDDSHCGMLVSTDAVLLGAWAQLSTANTILDIGSGSGVLTLMAAQRTKASTTITAIELDAKAYEDSQKNIANSPWPQKITLLNTSIQQYCLTAPAHNQFDHIICNPPFFNHGPQTTHTARANARHTNTLTFKELLNAIKQCLAPLGLASIIIPHTSEAEFMQALSQAGLQVSHNIAVSSVQGKPPNRLLLALTHANHNKAVITGSLYIRDKQGQYSAEMINLCQEFYLKL
ncbi:tRNA1(Val) (adenine(37)-N6)-methyltransferase [Shewanella gaetbuli]|uniref:tRNA1(Val) (adenine(37)-N6)-methyltransferase n=1 Tax=Shewanella gaetbuli TaxID=220752 RepID=A0A9X1ZGT1_9GAMM|nr:methyltransferase [Shewanella gaetbuli]MCL1141281.1 methyltransferase [Shewanella gaetbuli]